MKILKIVACTFVSFLWVGCAGTHTTMVVNKNVEKVLTEGSF
jgi:hypothetical protein